MSLLSRVYFVAAAGMLGALASLPIAWMLQKNGAETAADVVVPRPAFRGHPLEEGLTLYGARTYDAMRGAFLSTDPANKSVSGYTLNIANPQHYIDPTGNAPVLDIFEAVADIATAIAGVVTLQPEFDAAAFADLTAEVVAEESMSEAMGAGLEAGLEGALEGAGEEASATAATTATSAGEDLAGASSDLESIEGAVENMSGAVPDPAPEAPPPEAPEGEPPVPADNPSSPIPDSSPGTDTTTGDSPANTLRQQAPTEDEAPKSLGDKLIGWAKSGVKNVAIQAVSLGGMYEVTKLSEPAPPKKPIPKQK